MIETSSLHGGCGGVGSFFVGTTRWDESLCMKLNPETLSLWGGGYWYTRKVVGISGDLKARDREAVKRRRMSRNGDRFTMNVRG